MCIGQLSVKVHNSNFDTHSRQAAVLFKANDHELQQKALEIFEKLYDRRLLIRLIVVRLGKLVSGHSQIGLFDSSLRMADQYHAMDRIRHRHGLSAVMRAYGMQMYERRKDQKVEGESLPFKKLVSMYG